MLGFLFIIPLFVHTFFIEPIYKEGTSEGNICIQPQKNIAITFDDGPHRVRTSAILDTLKQKHIPATFFVVGNRLGGQDDILRRMLKEGHTIGNHSYSHAKLPSLSSLEFINETYINDLRIWVHTGVFPKYFRFPYGLEDERINWLHNGPVIGWSVDAADWRVRNPNLLIQKINERTTEGSIILLHDIKEDTMIALPGLIQSLKDAGYTFVSLDTLFSSKHTSLYHGYTWKSATKKSHIEKGFIMGTKE